MKFLLLCIYFTFVSSTKDPKTISLAKLTITPENDNETRIKLPSCEVDYQSITDPASAKMIIIFNHALSEEQSALVKNAFVRIPNTNKYELPYIFVHKTTTEQRTLFQKEKLVLHILSNQKVELKFPLGNGKKEKEIFTNKIESAAQTFKEELNALILEIHSYIDRDMNLKNELYKTKKRDVVQEMQKEIEEYTNTIIKKSNTLKDHIEEYNEVQRKIKELHNDWRDAKAEKEKKEFEFEMYRKLVKYVEKIKYVSVPKVKEQMNIINRYILAQHKNAMDYLSDDTNEIFEEFFNDGDYNSIIELLVRALKDYYTLYL